MSYYVAPLARLMEEFNKLPGIGKKTAQRLAFYVISREKEYAQNFARALIDAKEKIRYCDQCFHLTDRERCAICADPSRDPSVICVVESPKDVLAMENTKEYHGVYHVLHGAISPLNEIGPDDIRIKELIERVAKGGIREVILATNANVEGETTALYIAKMLKPFCDNITRLANGLPVGADIEYADEVTLVRALEGRYGV